VRRQRALVAAIVVALLALLAALLVGGSGSGMRRATAAARRSRTVRRSAGSAARTSTAGEAGAPATAGGGYPQTPQVQRLIALGRPIYCAPPRGNEVALTFDDGPGTYTRLMIAKLRKHHVGATFFLVGRNLELVAGAPRAERGLGAVGDHTFTHPLLTALAPAQAEAEIVHTQQALARASGGAVFLFRPPYGAHDAAIDAIVRRHGLLEILWNVDSRDSLGASYAQIERTVIAGLKPGAIILMHENHGQTIRAMLSIFAALERRHLRAVSVPQLLSDDPPTAAQVKAAGGACGLGAGAKLSGG
jgi:peptidoglycan/xylan/chitin deacetylase (PgdA/CDA1 family)